jgi:hypothetical protein
VVRTIACPVVRAAASSTRDDSERYVVNCGWATGTSSRCARAKATIEAMKARSLPFLSPQGSITGGRISIGAVRHSVGARACIRLGEADPPAAHECTRCQ